MNNEEALHVVMGSGQIGSLVTEQILGRGGRVRLVRRGPPGPARERLEQISGDLREDAFAVAAGRGAAVVYDCTSPAYQSWSTELLPVSRGVMRAAATAGAKLVALDNLYMYGKTEGPISETSPIAPCSRKGELRARLAEERALAASGGLAMTTARASDFLGAGVVRQTTFGERFYTRAFAGKSVQCLGDPDMPHALSYAPDVARALVTLADHDEGKGSIWLVPTNAPETMRQMVGRLASALALPIRIERLPRIVLRAMGVFSPLIREVAEMAYQWDAPYVVDDARFRAAFGAEPTPVDEIIRATAEWARATFGPGHGSQSGGRMAA